MLRKISTKLFPLPFHRFQFQGHLPYVRHFNHNLFLRKNNVYEPDYLENLQPKYPQYDSLNVQIKGYDYPILESYQRFVHQVAEYLHIEVSDCYAMPPQHMTAKRLRPNSTVVEAEYCLNVYERNLQLESVDAPIYPVFLRIIKAALPEGVELSVQERTEDLEERRYVPDRDLLELKSELGRIQTGSSSGGAAQKKR